jgi:hypothetical protein
MASEILATLSQRLAARYGKGYTYTAVTRMMKVARFYSDEEMFASQGDCPPRVLEFRQSTQCRYVSSPYSSSQSSC